MPPQRHQRTNFEYALDMDMDGPTPRARSFPVDVKPQTPPDSPQLNVLSFSHPASPPSSSPSRSPSPVTMPPTIFMAPNGKPLDGSEMPAKPKKGEPGYVKRPENAFILFRRQRCLEHAQDRRAANAQGAGARAKRQADLSKQISEQWKNLPAEERAHWDSLAAQKKREHEQQYPLYVYQPTRNRDKSKPAAVAGARPTRHRSVSRSRTSPTSDDDFAAWTDGDDDSSASSGSSLRTPPPMPTMRRTYSMPGQRRRRTLSIDLPGSINVPSLPTAIRNTSPPPPTSPMHRSLEPIEISPEEACFQFNNPTQLFQSGFNNQPGFNGPIYTESASYGLAPPHEIIPSSHSAPYVPSIFTEIQPRAMQDAFSPRSSVSSAASDIGTPAGWDGHSDVPSGWDNSLELVHYHHSPSSPPETSSSVASSPPYQHPSPPQTQLDVPPALPEVLPFEFDLSLFENVDFGAVNLDLYAADLDALQDIGDDGPVVG